MARHRAVGTVTWNAVNTGARERKIASTPGVLEAHVGAAPALRHHAPAE
jgi:hypothetical protein